ncbi:MULTISPECIES: hypothetical protein [unclassified Sinorhizobium]|uniref:DUF2207 family protein n=1 Tax=unclassified Sinorhizobium TaxID=2613772 RepID=UPI00352331FF
MAWITLCLILMSLTACSKFEDEFNVYSAESKVVVSRDGTALVTDTFKVMTKIAQNYGGVYVDIPDRFMDASGGMHWRDFSLLAARREGDAEYNFTENSLRGHSVYIGERRCRSCSPDLPLGPNKIEISYRLNRLVRGEGNYQVLVLPAYMGSIHDRGVRKTIVVHLPAGGTVRVPPTDQYEITQNASNELLVSIKTGKIDRVLPDIEIEYPAWTFPIATPENVARWWLVDHRLILASFLGPLITCLFVGFKLRTHRRAKAHGGEIDNDMHDIISPALAAYLWLDWKGGGEKRGFMASLCHLAIKGWFRISSLGDDAEVSDFIDGKSKAARAKRKGLSNSLRVARDQIRKQRLVDNRRGVKQAWYGLGDELLRAVLGEYEKARGEQAAGYLRIAVFILALGSAVAYFSGLVIFTAAICAILLASVFLIAWLRYPERFPEPTGVVEQTKQTFAMVFGLPALIVLSVLYVLNNMVTAEQLPYLIAICLDLGGIVLVLLLLRKPTRQQQQIRSDVQMMRRYLLGEVEGPEMSTELYERYLPFAIALDVEQHWTSRFTRWRENKKMDAYAPDWLQRI